MNARIEPTDEAAGLPKGAVLFRTLLDHPEALAPPKVLPSGIAAFDEAQPFGAIECTTKVLWGGEPGTGKSRWMLALALAYARKGHRVAYLLGEMSPQGMVRRALQMETGLGNMVWRNITQPHAVQFQTAMAALRPAADSIAFMRQPLQLESLTSAAAWADVVFVDPVQAIRVMGREHRHEELEAVMQHIEHLSVDEGTAFHLASEIGKPAKGEKKRTLHSAFKGSSALPQYADSAYLLERAVGGIQEVKCLKQREGAERGFTLKVDGNGLRITSGEVL